MLITTWLSTLHKRWNWRATRRRPPRKCIPALRRELEQLESRFLLSAVRPGFTNGGTLGPSDDGSTAAVPLGFSSSINFFGPNYASLYINNNGNVTFQNASTDFMPGGLTSRTDIPIIAPFFADVDSTGNNGTAGNITYGTGIVGGHDAFAATWNGVGYYEKHFDKLDTFQLVLIERFDTGPGNFDIEFNYDQVQWESGDSAGGVAGLGGSSARVGFSNGSGVSGTFVQLAGSGTAGSFLDSNVSTGLIHTQQIGAGTISTATAGRYSYAARAGHFLLAPTAQANGPYTVAEGSSILLSGAGSSDSDGTIAAYDWDYDYSGGTFDVDATGSSPSFPNVDIDGPATRTVALRVTDNDGLSHISTATVNVTNADPTANLTLSGPSPFYPGNTATFTFVSPNDPSPADRSAGFHYAFDFDNDGTFDEGDGTYAGSGSSANATYQPPVSGPVTVRGRILDDDGGYSDRFVTFTVTAVHNFPPVFSPPSAQMVNEDAPLQNLTISGIGPGGGADEVGQIVSLSVSSDNTALIPTPLLSGTGATRTLTYQPVANVSGTATITITADDGQPTDNITVRTFTIQVNPVNDQPTLDTIGNVTVDEDALAQTVSLTGIGPGSPADEATQVVSVTAVSSNPAIIPHPIISGSGASRTLTFQPVTNTNGGPVTITVTATDTGGTDNGGFNSIQCTFTITVTAVNDAPVFNAIGNVTVNEDAGLQPLNVTGIGPGGGADEAGQTVSLSAVSSNPSLIPNPTFTGSGASRTLNYTPVSNANGTATITVTANDSQSANNLFTRTFTITVAAVNDVPTLTALSPVTINEDAGTQTVSLLGISAGPPDESSQSLTITATSDNTALIPTPTVSYFNFNTTGTLTYTPVANANGSATITVTVKDNGGTLLGGVDTLVRTFVVNVTAVNDPPVFDAIDNQSTLEDSAVQSVSITGVLPATSAVTNETAQTVSFTATSNDQNIIRNQDLSITGTGTSRTLQYTPFGNAFGTVTITVTATDNGGTVNGGSNTFSRTFTVAVAPVNDQPTLNVISDPAAINEDAGEQTVGLSGISNGPANEASQTLTITADSLNTSLISSVTVVYTSGNATGTLKYTPVPNANGSALITVTATDNGGTANGGVSSIIRTFTVNVNAVNDAPTLDAIPDPTAILEDASPQTINLSGISEGPANEVSQTLNFTAVSDNPGLIPNPTVTFTEGNSTGALSYTPVANQNGTAIITVTLTDSGTGTNNIVRTFTVNVTAVNDQPTLATISDPVAILEEAGLQTIGLSGISAGPNESSQTLTFTAVSSNTALIPNPSISYTPGNSTASLTYTPVSNSNGSAVITVTLADNGGMANGGIDRITRTFTVNVTAVNDAPTLNAIPNPTAVLEDAGLQTIVLGGITAGQPNESGQTLSVTAVSGNTALIANPTVTYNPSSSSAVLTYTPLANANGTALVTVTVSDNGGTANSGSDSVVQTFTVTVTAVNDAPTFDSLGDQTVDEDSGAHNISITGVKAAAALPGSATDESGQTVALTAVSSNINLITNPSITGSGATRTLSYTPVGNAVGTVTITVTANDGGGTSNGGSETFVRTFHITVNPVNDAPTLDAITNRTVNEDAALQTVTLTGIGTGGGADEASQTVSVSASSDNPGLVPNPTITGSGSSRTLSWQPVANANSTAPTGSATITVTANDGQSSNGTVTQTFTITVNAVNDAPVFDPINNRTVNEDAASQSFLVTGIGPGGGADEAGQTVTLSATSDNTAIVPNPSFTGTGSARTLTFQPVANAVGTVTITVTASDTGGTSNGGVNSFQRTFTISVNAINDAPVFDTIGNQSVSEDATLQSLTIANVGPGGGTDEAGQTVTVTAVSSDPTIVPNPGITGSGTSRSLSYTPVGNANGTVTITVTATDNGGTASGGVNTFSRTFTITVNALNDAPTLTAISNRTITEDAGKQFVSLTGIGTGGGSDELTQTLTVTATSNFPALIPNPTVTGAGSARTLSYQAAANADTLVSGPITITVTVTDSGASGSGNVNTFSQTFTVTITAVNDAPVVTVPGNQLTTEDTDKAITGISVSDVDANAGNVTLTLSVLSGKVTLSTSVPSGLVIGDITGNGSALVTATATLAKINATLAAAGGVTYRGNTDISGPDTLTVSANDNGNTGSGTPLSDSKNIAISIAAVNDPPVLTAGAVTSFTVLEDSGLTSLGLGSVNYAPGPVTATDETGQTLTYTVTAVPAAAQGLIVLDDGFDTVVTVNTQYTLAQIQGMKFKTVADANDGPQTFSYNVTDNGGGTDTLSQSLTITVTAVNDVPTLTFINDPATILEDATQQTISLSGISAGPANESSQTITVTASSDDTSIIANPISVTYTSPGATGSLSYTPIANAFGTVHITVTVKDNGGVLNGGVDTFTRTFTVVIAPVNDAPTLNAIANPATILANAGAQTINLSGITAGPTNEGAPPPASNLNQTITIVATSNNTSLIPDPTVTYTNPNATGSLSYTPVPGATGTATITVTVSDNGGIANGGLNSFVRTFTVTVVPMQFDFDFTAVGQPATQSNYLSVLTSTTYNASRGYGWQGSVTGFDSGTQTGPQAALRQDGHLGTTAQTFRVDLANGIYYVNLTAGKLSTSITNMVVSFPTDTLLSDSTAPTSSTSVTTSGNWAAMNYRVQVTDASLDLNLSGNWFINGLEIRPVSATPAFTFSNLGAVNADGLTTSTVTATTTGLADGTLVSISTTLGTILTSDASSTFIGTQVSVSANTISFQIKAPTNTGTPTLTAVAITGASASTVTDTAVLNYVLPAVRRFDFNSPATNKTAAGFLSVLPTNTYTAALGYGWSSTSGISFTDRGSASASPVELYEDFHSGPAGAGGARAFRVTATPNTAYDVRYYIGDESVSVSGIQVSVESNPAVNVPGTPARVFTVATILNTVVSPDGILDFTIQGSSGWKINGLDVALSSVGLPQYAAGGIVTENPVTETLDTVALQPVIVEAIARWTAVGLTPVQVVALQTTQVQIRDLDQQGVLGLGGGNSILLDDNANGYGWYVDATPADDSEFGVAVAPHELKANNGAAAGRIDLLSVLMHEFGHVLGLGDLDASRAPHDLMTESLGAGIRRSLDASSLDAYFSTHALTGDL